MFQSNTFILDMTAAASAENTQDENSLRMFHFRGTAGYYITTVYVAAVATDLACFSGPVGTGFSQVGAASRPTGITSADGVDSEMDDTGLIHIITYDQTATKIYYTTFNTDTNTWSAKEAVVTDTVKTGGDRIMNVTVDSAGIPHVVYCKNADGKLYYTNRVGGTWSAAVAVSTDTIVAGKGASLRHCNGRLGLFYIRDSDSTLMARFRDGVGASDTWSTVRALTGGGAITGDASITALNDDWVVVASDVAWHLVGVHATTAGDEGNYDYVEIAAKAGYPVTVEESIWTGADWPNYHINQPYTVSQPIALSVSDDGEQVSVIITPGAITPGFGLMDMMQIVRNSRADSFLPAPWSAIRLFYGGTYFRFAVAHPRLVGGRQYVGYCKEFAWMHMLEVDLRRPPTAGYSHDITLDTHGFMLAGAMNKTDITASIPRISIASDQKKDFDFSELDTFGQNTLHQGRGERYLQNPEAFSDSDNVLTHIPNQVTLALLSYQAAKTGGIDTNFGGTVVKFFVYAANWYALVRGTAAAQNALYVWDNTNTELDTVAAGLDTVSGEPMDAAVYGNDLWIAQGEANNMRFYDLSAATWKDGQQPARALVTWDGHLWRADNSNEIYYSDNPDAGSPTWTLVGAVKDADTAINKLIIYQDSLFVLKEDTVCAIERTGQNTYSVREISDEDPYLAVDFGTRSMNGKGAFVDKGVLYWNRREQVIRFDGGTTSPIGPERGADTLGSNFIGLPSDEQGQFRSFTADGAFIYGTISPITGAYPQVMVYNGVGWHSFWKGTTVSNTTEAIGFLSKRTATGVLSYPTLWFSDGNSIRYIKLPRNSYNPTDDTTLEYVSSGTFDTAIYQAGLPLVEKVFGEILVRQDIPATNTSWSPYLKLNNRAATDLGATHIEGSTGWWKIPGATAQSTAVTLPIGESSLADLNLGNTASGIYSGGAIDANAIAFRLKLATSTSTNTPVIRGYSYRFVTKPKERYGWTMPIKAYQAMVRLDGEHEDQTIDDLRQLIYAHRTETVPTRLEDGNGALIHLTNWVADPSFQVTGFATTVGTAATNSLCTLHHRYRDKSQYVKITASTESGVSSGTLNPPYTGAGTGLVTGTPIYASVWILNEGEPPVTFQLVNTNNTVLAEVDVEAASHWQKAEISYTADGELGYRLRVIRKASDFTSYFHIDGAQFIPGVSSFNEYIEGDQPRCYWLGTPHASASVRRPGYLVYVTGLSETFRYRKTEEDVPFYESELTIQLREVL